MFWNWGGATDDRELWNITQAATELRIQNQDEDVSATINVTALRLQDRGVLGLGVGTAISISSTPDTTTSPSTAGSACRMSATAPSLWTPAETNVVDGYMWCCTNTGSNSITMTDSDGVYEGPGSVVGQWDQVCFEYVTDRFVERSFSNNEP
jgi:hypothetical protein